MKSSNRIVVTLGIVFIILAILVFEYILPMVDKVGKPVVITIVANHIAQTTLEAQRNDYTRTTNPLPQEVVDDLCSKLEIWETSRDCQSTSVLYAPDFFDEIKEHFYGLPKRDRTFDTIQSKLGKYFVECEKPSRSGHYICEYDLNNDGPAYHIRFFFNDHGYYYDIIANKRVGDT